MANLTVVVDEDVLKRARRRALDEGTSVNAVVREHLETYAGDDEGERVMHDFLEWARSVHAGSGPGGRTWTRDELYDR